MNPFDRRQFLRLCAQSAPALLAPALLSACARNTQLAQNPDASPTPTPVSPLQSPGKAFAGPEVKCDILVMGGTPAGIAAAIAAARLGARVILVEERPFLGGDIVYAMLNMFDVPMNRNGTTRLEHGIFGEVFKKLGIAFDVGRAHKLLQTMVAAEPNITVWLNTHLVRAVGDHGLVKGAVVRSRQGGALHRIRASCCVDATGDANFAAASGAQSFVGRESGGRDHKMQAAGLLFAVRGADWEDMLNYVTSVKMIAAPQTETQLLGGPGPETADGVPANSVALDKIANADGTAGADAPRIKHRLGGASDRYLWERGDVVRDYVPRGPDVLALSINFGLQRDGSVVLNTLNAVGVNGLDVNSRRRAHAEIQSELETFVPYLRGAMPGLENIRVARVAPELYIRETRHVKGVATLAVADIRAGHRFWDRIALASYPIDLHPYVKGDINPFEPQRYFYTIPLGALVPRDVDGVFLASRSLSATYEAAGSCRVIPATMAMGEAAGVAAVLCVRKRMKPHAMMKTPAMVSGVQKQLRAQGADIGDEIPVIRTILGADGLRALP